MKEFCDVWNCNRCVMCRERVRIMVVASGFVPALWGFEGGKITLSSLLSQCIPSHFNSSNLISSQLNPSHLNWSHQPYQPNPSPYISIHPSALPPITPISSPPSRTPSFSFQVMTSQASFNQHHRVPFHPRSSTLPLPSGLVLYPRRGPLLGRASCVCSTY